MDELFNRLEYAKNAVRWLLDNSNSWVDCHGIAYWASEIERCRAEIKEKI